MSKRVPADKYGMARYAIWQDQFWWLLGRFARSMLYAFGSTTAPPGLSAEILPQAVTVDKVWFNIKNPAGLGEGDWDRVSMAKAVPDPGGILLVTDVKGGPAKVSWFMHK